MVWSVAAMGPPQHQGAGRVSQLVGGREEAPVGERRRDDGGDGDAAEQRVEQDELQAHGVDRVGSGQQHADHRAGKEDQARRLRRVHERDHPRTQAAPDDRQRGLGRRGAQRERRLDRAAPARISSPSRLSDTAAAVIALPITMPPTGTRKRGSGSNTPSATTSASVVVPASASATSSGPNAPGTLARPVARGERAEQHHRGEQRDHEHQLVLLEDHVDHEADRRSAG